MGPCGLYMPALKAKAAALYELTSRPNTGKVNRTSCGQNLTDLDAHAYRLAESALYRFSTVIPCIHDRDYIVVQTMLYASFIHLRQSSRLDARTFNAGESMVRLIDYLGDADYPYLDPIVGESNWSLICITENIVKLMACWFLGLLVYRG